MDKYINSTKVLDFIQDCLNHEDKISDTEKATLIAIQRYIERTQIEDVAPVIHAEWLAFSDPALKTNFKCYCSNCHEKSIWRYPYCPGCGARMDGK